MASTASTGAQDVVIPAGGFASSSENDLAASELYSGPKSKKCPIHDSMAGYNGENIRSQLTPFLEV